MKVFVKGLNTCPQRNQKLQQYLAFLRENGHHILETPEGCDRLLVWTCGFRADVRDNTLRQMVAYGESHPGRVMATGCLPRIAPQALAASCDGEIFAWTDETEVLEKHFRTNGPSLAEAEQIYTKPALCADASQFRRDHPDSDVIFHDQFLQVMIAEGCPFRCTYCSERLAFPDFRSFPEADLVAAVTARMRETGQKDVILIADCLGEYGRDSGSSLVALVHRLAAAAPEIRVSFSNFHPRHFIEALEDYTALIQEGRIRHLNLPIQSASDRILHLMARSYTQAELTSAFDRLNQLGFTGFDTHVIVGFPSETDADFEETVAFLLRHRPRHVLLSWFMGCEDAPAARLPNPVPPDVMARRCEEAESRLQAAGILCNKEGGDMIQERLRRLNRVGGP